MWSAVMRPCIFIYLVFSILSRKKNEIYQANLAVKDTKTFQGGKECVDVVDLLLAGNGRILDILETHTHTHTQYFLILPDGKICNYARD